jgi:MFS family permease
VNAQNTPVHIRLWHHDFWRMAIANFLLAMSVYILIPVLPVWLMEFHDMSFYETGVAFGAFGVGLFLLGAFTSFLVQQYRRNMVCIWAIVSLIVCMGLLYYFDIYQNLKEIFIFMVFQRLLLGASFGLAQMVLSSTLIIDTCESYQRTEANHSVSWFSRFALSLGPMAGLILYPITGFGTVMAVAGGCALLAIILILLAHFPFRAPDDHVPVFSLDRFFLPHGFVLFVNLMLITLATGLLLSVTQEVLFYAMMMAGFLLAIIAQRFVFREAELKSEVVSGLILMAAAILLLLTRSQPVVAFIAPLFVGFGLGIIGSRFLLFFIKLSRHCQRGTSQSTYMLGWESGLAIGVGLGYAVFHAEPGLVLISALVLVLVSLLLYQFTHSWFLTHKNR